LGGVFEAEAALEGFLAFLNEGEDVGDVVLEGSQPIQDFLD